MRCKPYGFRIQHRLTVQYTAYELQLDIIPFVVIDYHKHHCFTHGIAFTERHRNSHSGMKSAPLSVFRKVVVQLIRAYTNTIYRNTHYLTLKL